MRERWPKLENEHSRRAIMGGACVHCPTESWATICKGLCRIHTTSLRTFAPSISRASSLVGRWPVVKIFPLIGILLSLIALSGCLSLEVSGERPRVLGQTYPRPTSPTHVTFQMEPYGRGQPRHTIPFWFGGRGQPGCAQSDHGGMPGVRKAFEESFTEAVYVRTPTSTGTYVHLEVLLKQHPICTTALTWSSTWHSFAGMSLFLLPWYDDDHGHVVHYHLYVDGALQRTYRYEISQKGIVWLPLVFFLWTNYFMAGETEAFEETARQFVADADRDGFFLASATKQHSTSSSN